MHIIFLIACLNLKEKKKKKKLPAYFLWFLQCLVFNDLFLTMDICVCMCGCVNYFSAVTKEASKECGGSLGLKLQMGAP